MVPTGIRTLVPCIKTQSLVAQSLIPAVLTGVRFKESIMFRWRLAAVKAAEVSAPVQMGALQSTYQLDVQRPDVAFAKQQ